MSIKCHFLRRNRSIVTRKANPGKPYVEFNDGLYMLDTGAVNLLKLDGEVVPSPELFYVEGNPLPLVFNPPANPEETMKTSVDERRDDDEERTPAKGEKEIWNTTPAGLFLDRIVIKMALENLEGPSSQLLALLGRLLKNPVTILIIAISIVIVVAGIGGFLGF